MPFCDWLSIYQDHPQGGLPIINDGMVWAIDLNGQIEWTTTKTFEQVGSHDTKIRIRSDGYRIKLDGNIGRFNRPDNVFGYSVSQCVVLANQILATYGIQPFTRPEFNASAGELMGGAILTRVDLTQNYACGSDAKAKRLVHYLGGQDGGRRATVKQYGDNGVTWNEGSKYQSSKLYIKADALGQHCPIELADWVKGQGIARHEISLKARYLEQKNLRHITDWQDVAQAKETDMDNIIYNRFTEVLNRGSAVRTSLEDIPKRLGHIALAWRAGKDVWGSDEYCKSTKRAWRKQLLPYGIDIKQPSNITRLNTRIEVIQLQAIEAPVWYWDKAA